MLCQSLRNSSKSPIKASTADSRIQKDLHELATARWTANCSVRITFPSTPNTAATGNGSTTGGQHATPHLHVLITPTTGAYAMSSFLFSIHLPSSYPFAPPHVRCLTPCLHPLLSFRTGRVYHPILHHDWKPVLTLNTVVFALQLLFHLHDSQPLTDGDEEVRLLLDSSGGGLGGGLFDVLVQQTLDGGFYFGMHWQRNREKTQQHDEQPAAAVYGAEVEERKEFSPQQRSRQRLRRDGLGGSMDASEDTEEADEDIRKRRKRVTELYTSEVDDEREAETGEEAERDDDRHRKHKQPHRHFLHRPPAVSPPLPLLHAIHRTPRRGHREERKEGDGGREEDDNDAGMMTRGDSFSFRALQSSLPGPHSPISSPSSVAAASSSSLSAPSSSARLFALSSSSISSSPALGSLATMQRQHAMRSTLGTTRVQPGNGRAAGGSDGAGDCGGVTSSVVRTLSSVMAD